MHCIMFLIFIYSPLANATNTTTTPINTNTITPNTGTVAYQYRPEQ